MNPQLEAALKRVRALPDERQQEAAELLRAFLDQDNLDLELSPEQIAEIERRAADDGPYATDEEVRDVHALDEVRLPVTAEEKLERIAAVFDTKRKVGEHTVSSHALLNLDGAIIDLDRTRKVDDVCLETLNRVRDQLREIGKILGI
jgi:hypothetical protein